MIEVQYVLLSICHFKIISLLLYHYYIPTAAKLLKFYHVQIFFSLFNDNFNFTIWIHCHFCPQSIVAWVWALLNAIYYHLSLKRKFLFWRKYYTAQKIIAFSLLVLKNGQNVINRCTHIRDGSYFNQPLHTSHVLIWLYSTPIIHPISHAKSINT